MLHMPSAISQTRFVILRFFGFDLAVMWTVAAQRRRCWSYRGGLCSLSRMVLRESDPPKILFYCGYWHTLQPISYYGGV